MISYTEATEEDIGQLTQMRIAYIISDQGSISEADHRSMEESLPIYFEESLGKSIFVFAAKDKGQVVSTVMLNVIKKPANPHFIHGRIGEVLSVYTKEEYRRQGIAGKLMNMLLDKAKELELDYVELSATEDGYKLYKSLGFDDITSQYHEMKYRL